MRRGPGKKAGSSKQQSPTSSAHGLVVNGWSIYSHPLFDAQVRELTEQVARDRERNP